MFETLIPQLHRKPLPVLLEQVASADKQQTSKTRALLEEDIQYCDFKMAELQKYVQDLKKYKEHVIKMNDLNYNESIITDLQEMNIKRQALLDQQAAEAFATHYKSYISSIDDHIKNNDYNTAVTNTLHILKLIKILNNPDESEVINSKKAAVVNMLLDLFVKDSQKSVHDQLVKLASPEQLKTAYNQCIDQFFAIIDESSFTKYLKFKETYKCDIPLALDLSHSNMEQYTHLANTLSTLKATYLDELLIEFASKFKENEIAYFSPTFELTTLERIYERGDLLQVDLDVVKETLTACLAILQNNLESTLNEFQLKYAANNKSIIIPEHQLITDASLLLQHSLFFKNPIKLGDLELTWAADINQLLSKCTVLMYTLLLAPLVSASTVSGSCEKMLLLPDVIDQIGFEASEMMAEHSEFQKIFEVVPMHGDHTLQTTRTVVMLYQCLLFVKYQAHVKDEHYLDLDYACMMITNIGIPVLDILNALKGKYPQYTGVVPEIDLSRILGNGETVWMQVLSFYGFDSTDIVNYFK